MSGRDLNPHRIHQARHYLGDDRVAQSANALRAIARGDYKRDRQAAERPREAEPGEPSPEAVRARLAATRISPGALAVACEHAEPGAYCWPSAHALCGERVAAAARARVA